MILFFSAMVFIRASGVLTCLNFLMVLYLLVLLTQMIGWPERKQKSYTAIQLAERLITLPVWVMQKLTVFGKGLIKDSPKRYLVAPVVRGVAIVVPILIVFLILFSSADLVFKHYVSSVHGFHISPSQMAQLLLVLVVTAMLVGTYALVFLESKPVDKQVPKFGKKLLGPVESSIILGFVDMLFLLFVIIQVKYLFGGTSNITQGGFTYSEYARKGFFELIMVGVISLLLLLTLHLVVARNNRRQVVQFMVLSGVLIAEIMLIMLSAFKRLAMYEQAYGFTQLRLYSHLFIGWLALVFVLLLVYIVRQQKDKQFWFGIFMSAVALLAIVNVINPDALITNRNINRYNSSGKIDVIYLGTLSVDATPAISSLLNSKNPTLRSEVASSLYARKQAVDTKSVGWQSFNLSRQSSNKILQQNQALLELNKPK
ncbi:MAG TPA: DUF4173 domain-containing protein, partial [Methylococcales bacterium]